MSCAKFRAHKPFCISINRMDTPRNQLKLNHGAHGCQGTREPTNESNQIFIVFDPINFYHSPGSLMASQIGRGRCEYPSDNAAGDSVHSLSLTESWAAKWQKIIIIKWRIKFTNKCENEYKSNRPSAYEFFFLFFLGRCLRLSRKCEHKEFAI